ncbi:hypothetical protein [Sorangium sp. So ce388]|uniref:hypothetical protein n=1 Tax=Sorangium sp. So ce388 TaxID=3133309 RepID=UPI003F5BD186
MKIPSRSLLRGSLAASLGFFAALSASPAEAGCPITFDDPISLSNVFAEARNSFAVWSRFVNGDIATCGGPGAACWMYRQQCLMGGGASKLINVDDDSGYGHYHLSFTSPVLTNPATDCFVDPGDGKGSGFGFIGQNGQCVAPVWALEPRQVNSHVSDQWIKVWNGNNPNAPAPFRMTKISVGSMPIQVWYHRVPDGLWFHWLELAANTTFTLDMQLADEVLISGADERLVGSFEIKGFEVL